MADTNAAAGGCTCGEAEGGFPPALVAFIDEWKQKPGCLIMILHKTQETFGYISRNSAEQISRMTGIPLARVYGVITFYHFFKTTKPGKHKVSVCLGTACYLKGGGDLIEEARARLGIKPGEVTKDGLFSVDEVRCVGCCGLAPVMVVGQDTYGKLKKDMLPGIFEKYT
ncbi:MAG: NAD(P)H-dependent oxidoreductase subunit E [Treponema sp.]|jgi:NADH-quinone oxidoreductase subunit E|nr:NAD(P)H-dependent oxidoreductase subunit E [Treponema sp.]